MFQDTLSRERIEVSMKVTDVTKSEEGFSGFINPRCTHVRRGLIKPCLTPPSNTRVVIEGPVI